mgnify:CR=1 FL=1
MPIDRDGFRIRLDNGAIDVTAPQDDRGEGLIAISLKTAAPAALLAAAKARGLSANGGRVTICGTHFDLS